TPGRPDSPCRPRRRAGSRPAPAAASPTTARTAVRSAGPRHSRPSSQIHARVESNLAARVQRSGTPLPARPGCPAARLRPAGRRRLRLHGWTRHTGSTGARRERRYGGRNGEVVGIFGRKRRTEGGSAGRHAAPEADDTIEDEAYDEDSELSDVSDGPFDVADF